MSSDRLCLMQVHAHPDDEASKSAATAVRYASEGVRTVLVTCTDGAAGEILNPAADSEEARADLASVRRRELDESVRILGYSACHLLGYRDSGMPESDHNKHPEAFANVPFDEAVGRLAAVVRAERPQVILAYGDDHSGYPHPDHIRAHEIAVAAFEAAGDAARFPDAGPAWQPAKLYYMGWTVRRMRALHAALEAMGKESWYAGRLKDADDASDAPFTTRIDVRDFLTFRSQALLAHRTQIAPDSFWFALPDEMVAEIYPYEEYALARATVPVERDAGGFETDLFSGLRSAPASGTTKAPDRE